jgi:AraC family transcriptional regulator, arabinose operon regulatory protein
MMDINSYVPKPAIFHPGSFRRFNFHRVLRSHGTQDWLMIYSVAGGGICGFAGGEYRSRPGEIILYRPGTLHDYRIDPEVGKWDIDWVHFTPRSAWIHWLSWPEVGPGLPGLMVLQLKDMKLRKHVAQLFLDMTRHFQGSRPKRQLFGENALEEILLWCDSINPQVGPHPDPRILRAVDFLIEHATEPFSEEKLARVSSLSPSRARQLFQAQIGCSPRAFQEERRIQRAREMLSHSDQLVGEIALELGFSSLFYFTLRFKRAVGESPSAYRRRMMETSAQGAKKSPDRRARR